MHAQSCTKVPGGSSSFVGMKNRPKTVDTLVKNLRELMKATGMTAKELAAKSGVSERMIGYIFAGERTPTVEVADSLAGPFGLTGWQLLIPGLHVDIAKTGKLGQLVHNYSSASDEGRQYIDRVAEQEAKYKID